MKPGAIIVLENIMTADFMGSVLVIKMRPPKLVKANFTERIVRFTLYVRLEDIQNSSKMSCNQVNSWICQFN